MRPAPAPAETRNAWQTPGDAPDADHAASGEHCIESGTRERAQPEGARLSLVSDGADLVVRCRSGEPAAFRQLFKEHRAQVARLVHRMTGGSPDLEDLVQEVFVQVHRSLGSFRRESRLSTWIYRIAVNVVLMHRRSQRSRPALVSVPEDALSEDDQPDEQLARRRRVAALYRLLDGMSEKKRTVYVLHELEGLAPAEIAKIVGAPVLTIRTRLFYARRSLLSELAKEPTLAALAHALPPLSDPAPAGHEPHKEPA